MQQNCWQSWPDRGFLIHPDPIPRITEVSGLDVLIPSEALYHIQQVSSDLPTLLENHSVRQTLEAMPVFDLSTLREVTDFAIVERFMQIYCYLASAFVYATDEKAEHRIPAGVAKPLYELSQIVERSPILTYSSYVLGNWQRVQSDDIRVDDLETVQKFLGVGDESWFILIHVDIEARATGVLRGLQEASEGASLHDTIKVEQGLSAIADSLDQMLATFARMPEGCDSNFYYFRVRPYIFGFTDVVYEGVEAYREKPQSFRGQTGAQSSIIPALVAGLGLQHEQTGLTQHLEIMHDYMPKPHQVFIQQMRGACIREFVVDNANNSALSEGYNECLRKMLAFRQMHLHYATTYIAEKVKDPVGTGGTIFMDWLSQLVRETESQLV
jgi:indoleamine 2,3-dioxygenase